MNDHVEVLRPIGVLVDGVQVLGAFIWIKSDGPLDVSAGGNPFRENVLLRLIIVAAAADHQECANWFHVIGSAQRHHTERKHNTGA